MIVYFEVFALILIILIGGFFKIYKLESIPRGLFCDKASTGYNVCSLLMTGHDKHGQLWSYPDGKPSLHFVSGTNPCQINN